MFPSTRQHAQLILYPSHKQFLTSRAPLALRSSRPRTLIVVSDSRLRSGFAAVLLPSLLFLAVPCQQNSHLPFFSGPQHYRLPKIKKKHNLYSEPCLRCKAGEGEEQALLKSPFEDGLKSARIEPALREHLFTLPGFVLQDGGFDLESTSRRCAQVRDALRHNVIWSAHVHDLPATRRHTRS